jgi:hypothetical protein
VSAQVTHHAEDRGKERLGLAKAALHRTAEIALRDGIKTADTTGQLRRYLDKLYFHDRTANNIRIHGEQVFIFADEKLITVHPVPRELRHMLAKVRERRRA